MTTSALIAFIHFIAALAVTASLVYEWATYTRSPTLMEARRIQAADAVYGMSAVTVLVAGFARVLYFEKGPAFYFENPFFWLKVGTFLLVGIASIYPTVKFLKWRHSTRGGRAPEFPAIEFKLVRWLLRVELIGLAVVVYAASMMAKGVGL